MPTEIKLKQNSLPKPGGCGLYPITTALRRLITWHHYTLSLNLWYMSEG